MSDTNQKRIEAENAFITRHRLEIARFGPGQFARSDSRGAVLVREATFNAAVAQFLYLTTESMEAHGLLDRNGGAIGAALARTLDSYDPREQVVLIFLYAGDASLYRLSIMDDLILPW